jgi:hypothetical protein
MKICGILCILSRPREIYKNNILLTRKIREIGKMCMEILPTVCSAAGHKNIKCVMRSLSVVFDHMA